MTLDTQPTQPQNTSENHDKEINFAKQRQQYERMLAEERSAREELERKLKNAQPSRQEDDEDDDEPYVDHKKLNRRLASFEKDMEQKIEQKAEMKARSLLDEEKKNSFLRQNNDFNNVMAPENVQKFAEKHPELAENILKMPEGFERQKLVYANIKALGIDRPETKPSSIQEKIDANRRSPYYQPSGVGSAPYASQGDFSDSGKKNAYEKMLQLKKNLRI